MAGALVKDRNRSWAEEAIARAVATCLQHVVGKDGKNCRNCGISAAWMAERNRRHGSSYEVPGSWPRHAFDVNGTRHVKLSMQNVDDEYIEVVW